MLAIDRPQPGDDIGTPHSCDNRYIFNSLDESWRPYDESDYKLSDTMRSYWTNFARTGDPNGPGLALWEPFDERELELRLSVDGCAMTDYNKDGRMGKLEDEICARLLD